MLAKRFFYVSAALFLLALTYHLGAKNATAQAPGNPVVAISGNDVITANGDVYCISPGGVYGCSSPVSSQYRGNIFGAPTPATGTSWGKVKADYRK